MRFPILTQRAREIDPPGVVPAWLVKSAHACAWLFVASMVYWIFTWSLDIARDEAVPLQLTRAGLWEGAFAYYFPLILGFLMPAVGLPWLAKIGIPIFCELRFDRKDQGWPKFWMGVIIALSSLVLIAGSMTMVNGARLEKNRAGAVAMESRDAGEAAKRAELDILKQRLADMKTGDSYEAKAAREGAIGWAEKVAIARQQQDPRLDRIERALSTAKAADALDARIIAKVGEIAAAPTRASVQARVVDAGDDVTGIVDWVNRWRALGLAVVSDLAALLLGWIAYRLEAVRRMQIGELAAQSPPAPDNNLRIEDQRDIAQPMPQEVMLDEDGEPLIKVRQGEKTYWRRKPRKRGEDVLAPLGEPYAGDPLPDAYAVAARVAVGEEPPMEAADASDDIPDPVATGMDDGEPAELADAAAAEADPTAPDHAVELSENESGQFEWSEADGPDPGGDVSGRGDDVPADGGLADGTGDHSAASPGGGDGDVPGTEPAPEPGGLTNVVSFPIQADEEPDDSRGEPAGDDPGADLPGLPAPDPEPELDAPEEIDDPDDDDPPPAAAAAQVA